MNPITTLIEQIKERLQDVPLAVRQKIYSYGALLVAVYGVWEASGGDWEQFWKSLGIAAVGVLARANATTPPVDEDAGVDDGPWFVEVDEEDLPWSDSDE